MTAELKTCSICGWTWDPNPWTKCPRCVARTEAYEPTPDEIRQACEAIQQTWSPQMKRARCALPPVPAATPVVSQMTGRRRLRRMEGLL